MTILKKIGGIHKKAKKDEAHRLNQYRFMLKNGRKIIFN